MHPLIKAYKKEFKKNSNKKNAIPMQNYMKSKIPFYGVMSPVKKKIDLKLKKEFKIKNFEEYKQVTEELWNNAKYREERATAITIAKQYKEFQTLNALPIYKHMIMDGAWWDYVDEISAHLIGNLLENYPKEIKKELKKWNKDKHMWLRRSSIISQLRFKENTDEKLLYSFIKNTMHEKEFFIRKAIGWALREYSKTNPNSVKKFVKENENSLSYLSKKEALRRME